MSIRSLVLLSLLTFATALSAQPTLEFSTYFGGEFFDGLGAVEVDGSGNIYVGGHRWTGGNGPSEFYVAKLNPTGTQVVYDVVLGGGDFGSISSLVVGADGTLYAAGSLSSAQVSTTQDAFQRFQAGSSESFIAKISPEGIITYMTYLGGSGADSVSDLAVDPAGNIVVAGTTNSSDFPTLNAHQPTKRDHDDAFVTKLNSGGTALVFSTFLGGNFGNFDGSGNDAAAGVITNEEGEVFVTGTSGSPTFPTLNALKSTPEVADAFVTRMSPNGIVRFSTFIGGSSGDVADAIRLSPEGQLVIVGKTTSTNFRSDNSSTLAGGWDAFICRMRADGTAIDSVRLFGGSDHEELTGVDVTANGGVFLTGSTRSTDLPTRDPIQPMLRGTEDIFIVRLHENDVIFSSYLGGDGRDDATETRMQGPAHLILVGGTQSTNYPTASAMRSTLSGGDDAVITAVRFPAAPEIESVSASPTIIDAGETTSLSVTASGDSLHYQWYQGGASDDSSPIAGATFSPSLITPAATDSFWVRVSNSGGVRDSAAVNVTVRPGPPTVTATATSSTTIAVTWTAVEGASGYRVYGKEGSGGYSEMVTVSTEAPRSFNPTVPANSLWVFRVVTISASGDSQPSIPDIALTKIFTDPELVGMPVKVVHLTELRDAASMLRSAAALAPIAWPQPGSIAASDVSAIRTAIAEARLALSVISFGYGRQVVAGATILAADFLDTRASMQ